MKVYRVFDAGFGEARWYRTLLEAKQAFEDVEAGDLSMYVVKTPISKDQVINLLNQEGFALRSATLVEKSD